VGRKYDIVKRLKAGRPKLLLGDQPAPTQLEIEAADLIQELGDALTQARPFLSAGAWRGSPDEVAVKIDAILSKLKGA